jgi:hypothetical protein
VHTRPWWNASTDDLVDVISIFTVPVVPGGGKNLFADSAVPHSFRLTRSRVSPRP